ncbi:MAG: SDR family NAD(P)-dependent oxidoreductase [Actinomycetales bacterium]|nr:SDR family NAD(P)-dependent oxidoreductase [Actinomycetales bacterium]
MQITDKVFVVTGGGNGIGREVVLGLLERGARVAALDLRADSLEKTADLADDVQDRLTLHATDVSDNGAVKKAFDEALAAHKQIDGLINVAGIIQRFVPIAELDIAEIEKVMAVNFWGVVYTTKAALPLLLERPEACIVNVSSMGGFTPVPGQTAYGASKAAVKLFTEGLYAELRGTDVAVTAVFPGAIGTDISVNSGVATAEQMAEQKGGGSSFPMTPAPDAGAQVIEAVEKGPYRMMIGKDAAMLDRFTRLSPQRATEMIAKKMASLVGS